MLFQLIQLRFKLMNVIDIFLNISSMITKYFQAYGMESFGFKIE